MRRDDDWLDAFTPSDCHTEELAALDAATARLLARVDGRPPMPVRAPVRWPRVMSAVAAVGAAAVVWLAVRPAVGPEAAVSPVLSEAAPLDLAPDVAPVVAASLPAAAAARQAAAAVAAPAAAVAVAASPRAEVPFGPGLRVHDGARAVRVRDEAVLSAGALTFVREPGVDPGVASVRVEEVGLVLDPVGTHFTVVAGAGAAVLSVHEGRVTLRTAEVDPLALVSESESVLVVSSPTATALRVVSLRGLDLAEVRAAVEPGGRTSPADAVALVARLRLLDTDDRARRVLLTPDHGGVP